MTYYMGVGVSFGSVLDVKRPRKHWMRVKALILIMCAVAIVYGCASPTELPPIATIHLATPKTALTSYEIVQLTATMQDKDGQPLPNRSITWRTSNAVVARVSATGMVTAGFVTGGTVETVVITAVAEGKKGSITQIGRAHV
mgnify:CR=1 FL=1